MCTIVIANHHYKEFPLVISANRDEDYNRKSLSPQILSKEPLIVGGKDEQHGGSWLAVNNNSLFVAIANQGDKSNPKLKSRGLIITEALKRQTLEQLIEFVEEINPSEYNSFNLVFGNQSKVYIAQSYILHGMVIRELSHGVNVITSNMKFVGENVRAEVAHKRLEVGKNLPWLEYYKVLKKMMNSADYGFKVKPRKSVNGKYSGFCTRSTSILAFSDEGLARYKFYDRTDKSKKNDNEEPFHRYKDYIDMWRNPDIVNEKVENSEEEIADKK